MKHRKERQKLRGYASCTGYATSGHCERTKRTSGVSLRSSGHHRPRLRPHILYVSAPLHERFQQCLRFLLRQPL
eukprot:scaffold1295_cov220-Pinguiococcus_pyrenoidosus.AAC.2